VIGVFVAHFLTKDRNKTSALRNAYEKLIEAFEGELTILKSGKAVEGGALKLLEDASDKHQLAVETYERNLSGRKLRRYNKMWRKYNCNVENQPNEEKQIKFLEKYMTNGVSRQRAKRNKKIAIRNIENFLKAAKP
jgi:hypothetical protein